MIPATRLGSRRAVISATRVPGATASHHAHMCGTGTPLTSASNTIPLGAHPGASNTRNVRRPKDHVK